MSAAGKAAGAEALLRTRSDFMQAAPCERYPYLTSEHESRAWKFYRSIRNLKQHWQFRQ